MAVASSQASLTAKDESAGNLPNYIGGRWVLPSGSEALAVLNPATGEVLVRVPLSERDDVAAAVAAAREAFPGWRQTPAEEEAP